MMPLCSGTVFSGFISVAGFGVPPEGEDSPALTRGLPQVENGARKGRLQVAGGGHFLLSLLGGKGGGGGDA